uniref:Cytochrome b n=1 Tax=Bisetocreagris titanium TaxID=2836860 RepID=A0A8F7KKV3_9ARAC|nr:cytochrome b [Bisetocreagris titanium]
MLKLNFKPLFNLPTPNNISYWWNFGSMLGITIFIQIITGLLVTMYYCPSEILAFSSISKLMQNINFGWLLRFFHSTGASVVMVCIYLHIFRNLYNSNFKNKYTSFTGMIIYILMILIAFLGYVLPWGQMSFWGATVITSLVSVIPWFGQQITMWLWGNFTVSSVTLNRFFMFHFLLPMILMIFILFHLMFLHKHGSLMTLNFKSSIELVNFYPKFLYKDLISSFWLILIMLVACLKLPYFFMNPENFIPANPLLTPTHIEPEWYFLPSYAILRCIPNKVGGVVALIFSIMVFLVPIMKSTFDYTNSLMINKKFNFWLLVSSMFNLMWIGSYPVSDMLIMLAQGWAIIYFSCFCII